MSNKLTGDELISDILMEHLHAQEVLLAWGLTCANCAANPFETLKSGAAVHSITGDEFTLLLEDLQEGIATQGKTSHNTQDWLFTEAAVQALRGFQKSEDLPGWGVRLDMLNENECDVFIDFAPKADVSEQTYIYDTFAVYMNERTSAFFDRYYIDFEPEEGTDGGFTFPERGA